MRLFSLLLLAALLSITAFSQEAVKTKVWFNNDFPVYTKTISDAKYITDADTSQLKQAFLLNLAKQFGYQNMDVTDSIAAADYSIQIKVITFSESCSTETVNDAASEYNGQTYSLHKCECSCVFTVFEGAKDKSVKSFDISENKEEKLTNSRNIGQYITGDNKDGSVYRHKELPDDVYTRLAEKVANRTENKTTRIIEKAAKKKK